MLHREKKRLGLVIPFLLLLQACGGGGGSAGGGTPGANQPQGKVVDVYGEVKTKIGADEALVVDVSGLSKNTNYRIVVTDANNNAHNPDGGFIASTDEFGKLSRLTVLQDLGQVSDNLARGGSANSAARRQIVAGTMDIEIKTMGGETIHKLSVAAVETSHLYCADATGLPQASFLPNEIVNVQLNLDNTAIADGTYNLYVVIDTNNVLKDGDLLYGNSFPVTTSGGKGLAQIGSHAIGIFDVVLDVNGNGHFDFGIDIISRHNGYNPCFSVQQANTGNAMVVQIAADENGVHRHNFEANGEFSGGGVYAYLAPTEQSSIEETLGVQKFVVAHQDVWSQGDPLTDVTGGVEVDPVQGLSLLESPWLIWPRQLLQAGCYDVVIDVNRNSQFDLGIDYVDNIDASGNNTCGMVVGDAACNSLRFTSHTQNQTVAGPTVGLEAVVGNAIGGTLSVSAGARTTEIPLNLTTDNFAGTLPLFAGKNRIVVNTYDDAGNQCSRTIDLNNSAFAEEPAFRMQLIWEKLDFLKQVDVHMLKPNGTFRNDLTDCWYWTCYITGNASGTPGILDWGVANNLDDNPVMDTLGGNFLIADLYMKQISENGDYTLIADTGFVSNGKNVIAKIYIYGQLVSTVSCGTLEANSPTNDACVIGTLSWSGGASGAGSFSADGRQYGVGAFGN